MSDKELLAQIAQVAGAINKHMNTSAFPSYSASRGGYSGRGRGRGRGTAMPPIGPFNRKLMLNNTASPPASPHSWTPSPSPVFAPAVKPFVRAPAPSRHLSLVNNTTIGATGNTPSDLSTKQSPILAVSSAAPISPLSAVAKPSPLAPSEIAPANMEQQQQNQQWIQSKGKNMSMMNPASYKKTMEAKLKSIRTSKEKKLKLRQAQAKLASDRLKGIVTVGGKQYNKSRDGRKLVMRDSSMDNIVINGMSFEMDPRGNKLVRKTATKDGSEPFTMVKPPTVATTTSATKATPKQFSMGGVVYVRTRNGNLVRATLVKKQLLEKRSHLAICKKFLRGSCPNDSNTCHLSHNPSPHTTPACSHFQRAACSKDNCPYPHIRINPQAPICRPFATEGWCETGVSCKDRHVWICPDFGTPAGCKKKCGLAHVANGGIRVKRSAEEMEKERQEHAASGNGTGHMDSNKRKRLDSAQQFKSTGRYMDGLLGQNQDQDQKDIIGIKRSQHDEDFVPFDLGDEEGSAFMDQDESEVMGDFEGDQEVDEDEDDEDVSSDVDDEVGVESEEDEDEDAEDIAGADSDSNESDNYDDELERFYEEQDRDQDDY
ncbi:hypothetical protein BGX27_009399 [Mortierella sp. AM989]|nr:hypothetical protein BGX27_009399 [Mortierella sp. AM989]